MGIKSVLKALAFHANGRPRGWLRRLVFDKTVVHSKDPKPGFYYLVYGFDGQPRAAFASWLLPGLNARKQFDSSTNDKKRTDIIQANTLAGASRISIITPRGYDDVAGFLQSLLKPLCGEVALLYDMPQDFPDDLYFVLCPHHFNDLPPPMKRIVYQLEKSKGSAWFGQNYIDNIRDSLAIFQYDIDTITHLQSHGILYRDVFYMPLPSLLQKSGVEKSQAEFFFYRALLALGMIDYDQFYDLTKDWVLPDEPLLLNLPENPDRRIWAQNQCQQNSAQKPPVIFNGLRHRQSWIGCAFSYKYIGQKAIEQGIKQVQIQEDDAKFLPQYDMLTPIIRDYLAENIGEWDGFVGLLIDCPQSAKISRVSEFNGVQFIHIDFFISTVYGIYATPMLHKMADYPLKPFAQMTKKDAIDTYLNCPPVRVVTVSPFIVEHCTEFDSTLWPVNNAETTASIEATQARLAQMVAAFLAIKTP